MHLPRIFVLNLFPLILRDAMEALGNNGCQAIQIRWDNLIVEFMKIP